MLMTDQKLGTAFTVQILNKSKASHFNDPKEINILKNSYVFFQSVCLEVSPKNLHHSDKHQPSQVQIKVQRHQKCRRQLESNILHH